MIVSVTVTDSREAEIADAIRSVVAHVDRVLLLDTGVTDSTVERAREVAGEKLSVAAHSWVDFSAARNAALDAARELGAEWILIIDSDERIDLRGIDLRKALAAIPADIVCFEASDGRYPKEKILRAASEMRFVGPTHEALVGGTRATLRGPVFRELEKSDAQLARKCRRDVALLTAYLKTHSEEPRWWYYLGASYESLGDLRRAADAFGRCAGLRKTGDEAAWSFYKQAEQFCALNRFEEAIVAAAQGLAANASFAECAWIAAVASLRLGRRDQAVAWAQIAETHGRYAGYGGDRPWFRHLPALYELPYEVLSQALPNENERIEAAEDFRVAKLMRLGAIGDHDLDRLSVSRSAPDHIRSDARSALYPPMLAVACPSAKPERIRFEPPDGYFPMNPSICQHNGALWCVVRAVNYSMSGRRHAIHDEDGIARTRNYLGKLDLDTADLVEPHLMNDLDNSARHRSKIVGYEDLRLISLDGKLTGSATVCDRDPRGRRRIARLEINDDGDVTAAIVQPSNQESEKNWMPLVANGVFTWIYSLDPTAILPGPLWQCPLALDHLRGGAVIERPGGYLCVTHETFETPPGRIYVHRFVRLDKKFRVQAVSRAWVFGGYGIEFCAGLARHGDELVISYGVEDREAWIMRVNEKEVENMDWIAAS